MAFAKAVWLLNLDIKFFTYMFIYYCHLYEIRFKLNSKISMEEK